MIISGMDVGAPHTVVTRVMKRGELPFWLVGGVGGGGGGWYIRMVQPLV
jgi:hypothetical protein